MPSHWSARRLVENVLEVIPTAIVTNSLRRTWSIVDCETYHQYANLLLDKGVSISRISTRSSVPFADIATIHQHRE
ncbi:hypothetical protein QSH57_012222 [Fusarium oxysporum f. sp. vasinfectum]|nr:hypothetical protein QSH57_012222 [Fusarium oxysporum f. sp. vasinfectum]